MSIDPSSQSNSQIFATKHIHLDLSTYFDSSILKGHVQLRMIRLGESHDSVVHLDTRAIDVSAVHIVWQNLNEEKQNDFVELANWMDCKFELEQEKSYLGSRLSVYLPKLPLLNEPFTLRIQYATSRQCTAVQWLTPAQTVGKKHPYMFTQCQAIHARALLPCQDTPLFKITYSAALSVEAPLVALMSAARTGEKVSPVPGRRTFTFYQQTPIPSYLIAIAVGDLVGKDVGPRTTVWSEPAALEAAAYEFSETEQFLSVAESFLTPYAWGRYDLLCLPASFPYGGMENPCLTYVTPTLLAGDRSLVGVVAHEIAHSWMGNLVTTANWQHFWLNEGFTVFVERKILGKVYGENVRQFKSIIGWTALKDDVARYGETHALTALVPDLHGVDPDDAFSSVPYEKGNAFLYYLEDLVGGAAYFEPYLKAHVTHFAGQSITTHQWQQFFISYFNQPGKAANTERLKEIDWDRWFKAPGMPPVTLKYDTSLSDACTALAKLWIQRDESSHQNGDFSAFEKFTPGQKVQFLEQLSEHEKPLQHDTLAALDATYQLSAIRNAEIRFRWQLLALKASYRAIDEHVIAFVVEQGRMKFVRPLYRALAKVDKSLAVATFQALRDSYHPIASSMIAKDLGL